MEVGGSFQGKEWALQVAVIMAECPQTSTVNPQQDTAYRLSLYLLDPQVMRGVR